MVAVKPKSVVIRFQICIFDTLNTAAFEIARDKEML